MMSDSKPIIDLTNEMEFEPEPPTPPYLIELMEAASNSNYKKFFSLYIQHESEISPKAERQVVKQIDNPERFVDIAVLFEMYDLALSICKATGMRGCSGDELENVLIDLHDPDSDSFHALWRFLEYSQDTDFYGCAKCNLIYNDPPSDSSDYESSSYSDESEDSSSSSDDDTQNIPNEPTQNETIRNEGSDAHSSDFDSSDGESIGLQSSSSSSEDNESSSDEEESELKVLLITI